MSERAAPPSKKQTNKQTNIFIKLGETLPVCREHVRTGRPHTRIDNSNSKKSNVMSFH